MRSPISRSAITRRVGWVYCRQPNTLPCYIQSPVAHSTPSVTVNWMRSLSFPTIHIASEHPLKGIQVDVGFRRLNLTNVRETIALAQGNGQGMSRHMNR
ncbi:hypothetical protein [Chroococcidiopsis sp. CCMEE 29]|uniref:hypothetical protein n=1 Tax=Chroococcidiopsis sp. CCMEE 29 TaxID=155894 RepID=UPI002021D0A2|nr:hypothetical protein [Chroococcidiopsis sp. CCMEE 29]